MQIAGNILSDGTTRVDSGSGFVSSRSGVGEYVLSFPDGTWNGTTRPIIVVSPASSVGPTPVIGTLGLITWADTGSLVVNAFFYDVNGNPVDTEWNFVVTQS